MSDLKKTVKQLADTAMSLPDNLQVVCFELLLKDHLGQLSPGTGPAAPTPPPGDLQTDDDIPLPPDQDDLVETDLHAKTRKFLHQHGLSIDHVNNLFYKEGDDIQTLYEDLGTTVMAEGQIRIALLQALTKALPTGSFEADVEAVRTEATDRKFYDGPNFAKNFRNSKELFDFDKWSKEVKSVRLSTAGKKKLVEVIKELQ